MHTQARAPGPGRRADHTCRPDPAELRTKGVSVYDRRNTPISENRIFNLIVDRKTRKRSKPQALLPLCQHGECRVGPEKGGEIRRALIVHGVCLGQDAESRGAAGQHQRERLDAFEVDPVVPVKVRVRVRVRAKVRVRVKVKRRSRSGSGLGLGLYRASRSSRQALCSRAAASTTAPASVMPAYRKSRVRKVAFRRSIVDRGPAIASPSALFWPRSSSVSVRLRSIARASAYVATKARTKVWPDCAGVTSAREPERRLGAASLGRSAS